MSLLKYVKFNRIILKKCNIKEKLILLKIQNTLVIKTTIINNNEANLFYINDVNFFNLFYNNKTIDIFFIIKHFNKNTFF